MKSTKTSPNLLPDLGDILFLLILQLLLFHIPNYVFGDGSTGWHLVTGNFIMHTLSIPHADIISYTFPGASWVAYEWLCDAFMAAVAHIAGLNGVAVVFSSFIALLFLLLYERCRKLGCHFALAVLLTVLGAIASSMHWLARPHIFTFLFVYVYASTLEDYRRGTVSGVALLSTLAVCMLLWVNLHPGFLAGLLLILLYLASELAIATYLAPSSDRDATAIRIKWLMCAMVVVSVMSLVNPYGLELYSYVGKYFQGSQVLAFTDEYRSPTFHGGIQSTCFEVLIWLLVIGLAISRRRLCLVQMLSCITFGSLALMSVRNIPVFVVVALPIIAELLATATFVREGVSPKIAQWWHMAIQWWQNLGQGFDKTESKAKVHILPIVAVVVLWVAAANSGKLFGSTLMSSSFDPGSFPTSTVQYIRDHNLSPGRGFNFDNWGGYIKYKLGIPVFIDDRADFYGEKFYLDYGVVSMVSPGWQAVLDRYNIAWILFPRTSQLAARLKEQPDWKVVCEDPAAYLFVRKETTD